MLGNLRFNLHVWWFGSKLNFRQRRRAVARARAEFCRTDDSPYHSWLMNRWLARLGAEVLDDMYTGTAFTRTLERYARPVG